MSKNSTGNKEGNFPDEIEMSRCPQCDHSIPTFNMALHRATICGAHSSNSSTTRRQRQTKGRPNMSHSNLYNESETAEDDERSAHLQIDQSDVLSISSPPRSRARTSRSQINRGRINVLDQSDNEEDACMQPRRRSGVDLFDSIRDSVPPSTSASASAIESKNEYLQNRTNRKEEVIEIDDSDSDGDEIIEAGWVCSRCTLHNPMDSHTCMACAFTQVANTNKTRANNGNDEIRNPDPTRRERLIEANNIEDGFLNISMMDEEQMRAISMQDYGNHSNPNNSVYRSIGSSAILGSAIGAFSGLSRNRGFLSSAVEGAFAGAVGGAISHGLSRPGGNQNQNQNQNMNQSFSSLGQSYRIGSGPSYRMIVTRSNGIFHLGMPSNRDAIDGMSYDDLLETYGDGSENRGTDPGIIRSLPTTTLTDAEHELPKDYCQCCICLDDFENGQKRKTLPCLHG